MHRQITSLMLLCCVLAARGQTVLSYWLDDAYTTRQTVGFEGNSWTGSINVSGTNDGIHVLHTQIVGNKPSPVTSQLFLKLSEQAAAPDFDGTIRYWIDDNFANIISTPLDGGIFTIDVSELKFGIHTLHVVAGEIASSVMSQIFVRLSAQTDAPNFNGNVRYWIDDDFVNVVNRPLGDGLFAVDISALKDGIHTFHVVAGDDSPVISQLFLKLTERELPSFSKYEYWVNSEGFSTVGELPSEQSTVQLISLLPVAEKPIRSSCFHFAVEDTSPVIYAQNDIRLRFHLSDNHFTDVIQQYTDYRTKQVLTNIIPLEPNTSKSFSRPGRNSIQWLSFEAEAGDTVAFKLSQPTTLQLFAPSGEEVFKTSESASVNWGGIHTWEEGTYYLAVHDVTGSQSTMKLEYMHMDKYDVVDWDVHTVGNGGCSTITFKGNGFRDLYGVDLVIAPGDTIHSVDVSHDSDAETAVTFDFTAATLGDYNAVFHFTEEDKPVANVVTVEEAVDIELATDVTFPSTFLRGTSTTYTIKITNKGNMTAYAVPIYTWLKTKSQDGISHIEYEGLGLPGLFDNVVTDSLSVSDFEELKVYSEAAGDDHYFLKFWAKDGEIFGDSVYVRSNYFFTNIAPLETKMLRLTISAKEEVLSYFSVPKDWTTVNKMSIDVANVRFKTPSLKDRYCCVRDRWECVANVVSDGISVVNMIADLVPNPPVKAVSATAECIAGVVSNVVTVTGMAMCDDNSIQKNFWEELQTVLTGISITETLITCASAYLPAGDFKNLAKAMANGNKYTKGIDAFSIGADVGNCIKAFTEKIPNCPPNPDGGGGTSSPQPPSDPNDIIGYLSESGSKFIADSVARVNYTIEFENDTTFATAAAHTIVIKDTLDSRYFDLTKFMPTGIKIGEREAFLDAADVVSQNNTISFVKTIDMRPEIYAIAQVDGTFNQKTGIAQWIFQSLDPMTMEPTDDLMQGILPVNYNGTSGIGEVMFEVGVKQGKADGTQIKNRAGIVFDYEEAILTPTWTNIVDAVAPSSFIDEVVNENDSTISFHFFGEDNASGIWKYRFYVQAGQNAPWWEIATDIAPDSTFCYRFYDDIDYGFCVLAVDSAGNVEKKVLQRECNFKAHDGDYEVNVDELPASSIGSAGDTRIYDLSGRRHDEPQEGINIIDNKKVLFRRKN